MSTIFYAVQCCQCFTMQVKQRKTSSKNNKWTCVVCNQKQSARKVFAESPMARDLRPFVQSSNMASQFTHQDQKLHHHEEHAFFYDVHQCGAQKKRRTDCTEYLDGEAGQRGDTKQEDDESGGYEPQVVTELPPELLEKPKKNRCFDASGSGDKENGGPYELQNRRPVMSVRNSNKHVLSPEDLEDWRCELTMNKNTSDCSLLMLQENKESRSLQVTNATLTGASKWNDYVSKDDNDGLDSKWNDYVTKDD
ncbi:uncharacterized protein LOC126783953 [Argentina anserina]|uniref:uncharacterized protein LOC126783953 n=1 Tax=Argentina anserina TaxID=57926 RepID=UPI0021767E3D|nr:uncharacterized protein LOC126783953 [Potentilla anserina]